MSPARRPRPATIATAVVGCLVAVLLAGCGSGSSAASGPTRAVVDVEETKVTVPEHPQRVVALSEPTLDAVVALGVTPVGAVNGRGQSSVPGYLAAKLKGVPTLGNIAQPNYEAIAKVRPDLILVDGTSINNNADAIAALRKIAPTVVTGYAGGAWRLNFEITADALNLAARGRKVEAGYDAEVAAARKRLTGYGGKTFSVVRWQGGAPSLILKELPAGEALSDLGLARPRSQNRKGLGHSDPVSLENLSAIDADYLFFGTLGGSSVSNPDAGGSSDAAAARKALASAEKTPGFTRLTAYKQHHIICVDGSVWTSTGGPILMGDIVDTIVKELAK